jgi:hypothetical protein
MITYTKPAYPIEKDTMPFEEPYNSGRKEQTAPMLHLHHGSSPVMCSKLLLEMEAWSKPWERRLLDSDKKSRLVLGTNTKGEKIFLKTCRILEITAKVRCRDGCGKDCSGRTAQRFKQAL